MNRGFPKPFLQILFEYLDVPTLSCMSRVCKDHLYLCYLACDKNMTWKCAKNMRLLNIIADPFLQMQFCKLRAMDNRLTYQEYLEKVCFETSEKILKTYGTSNQGEEFLTYSHHAKYPMLLVLGKNIEYYKKLQSNYCPYSQYYTILKYVKSKDYDMRFVVAELDLLVSRQMYKSIHNFTKEMSNISYVIYSHPLVFNWFINNNFWYEIKNTLINVLFRDGDVCFEMVKNGLMTKSHIECVLQDYLLEHAIVNLHPIFTLLRKSCYEKMVANWAEISKCFKEKNREKILEILEKCQNYKKIKK